MRHAMLIFLFITCAGIDEYAAMGYGGIGIKMYEPDAVGEGVMVKVHNIKNEE
jgi:hypothetical protein